MFTNEKPDSELKQVETGVIVKSMPDIRWLRRDIKTVNLLGQVLAKQAAHNAGAYEALMIDTDGYITECGSTSFYIIKDNKIITRHLSNDILPGVTRKSLLRVCENNSIELEQRLFTLDEVFGADEAFITGASTYVLGVVKVDDHVIGDGRPGATTNALLEMYLSYAKESLI
jgi:D-alanine transaminase